jgi:hypothetical protein
MINIVRPLELDNDLQVFKWQGNDYVINFAYDNVLRWFKLLDDPRLDDIQRTLHSFAMFVGSDLDVPVEVQINEVGRIADLITETEYHFSDNSMGKTYDYEQDSEAIYASFMSEYGIDLIEQKGKLNYFKFKALFNNLSSKSAIQQIMKIRQTNPADYSHDPKYLQQLMELKNGYALNMSDEDKDAMIGSALDNL